MAYCVKCGVELDRNQNTCPLCNTPVYYPEESEEELYRKYPDRRQRREKRHVNLVPSKAFVYLMTFIIVVPIIVCLMVDIRRNGTLSWSFYPATSLLLIWILMAYPALMKRYSFMKVITIDIYSVVLFLVSLDIYSGGYLYWSVFPVATLLQVWVFFLLADLFGQKQPFFIALFGYVSMAVYLYLIEQATRTIWFLELALPLLTMVLVVVLFVLLLSRLKFFKGVAFPGLLFLALGLFCLGAECFINRFVFDKITLFWSLIVIGVTAPAAVFLFFIHSNEEFRVYLQKKFHL